MAADDYSRPPALAARKTGPAHSASGFSPKVRSPAVIKGFLYCRFTGFPRTL